VPLAILSVYISLYQGIIVQQEKTGPVAEAVAVFLLVLAMVMITGVVTAPFKGVYMACLWLHRCPPGTGGVAILPQPKAAPRISLVQLIFGKLYICHAGSVTYIGKLLRLPHFYMTIKSKNIDQG
jgi:hypothetical protein